MAPAVRPSLRAVVRGIQLHESVTNRFGAVTLDIGQFATETVQLTLSAGVGLFLYGPMSSISAPLFPIPHGSEDGGMAVKRQ